MSQVLLSELAEGDLADFWLSIATESIDTADAFLGRLRELLQKLADQPLMGRLRPELGADIRSFAHARYVSSLPLQHGGYRSCTRNTRCAGSSGLLVATGR